MAHRLVVLSQQERIRLAGLAAQARCRKSAFTMQRPCEWDPDHTYSRANYSYTPAGAWAFLCELLLSEIPIYLTTLDKPPGASAYVFFLPPEKNWPGIYIKFEIAGPGLYGRSFHHPKFDVLELEPASE
jgi:hypothetical protein